MSKDLACAARMNNSILRHFRSMRLPAFHLIAAVGLVAFAFAWVGIKETQQADGTAAIWLADGLVFAVLSRTPRSEWPDRKSHV